MEKRQFAHREPRQARGIATRARLVAATEELLAQHDFDTITIEAVTARAATSIGAFYKQFASKHALLLAVLAELQNASGTEHQPPAGLDLRRRIEFLMAANARVYVKRRRLVRACTTSQLRAHLNRNERELASARARMRLLTDWLLECRSDIRRPDPERAVRTGLFLCLQALQSTLLAETLPADLTVSHVVGATSELLIAYLHPI